MWSFRKIVAIEEPVFNNTLEHFYELGIDGLVRENIQNSLDGKLPESNLPVEVRIKTGMMQAVDIPGISEIRAHIDVLKGENSRTRSTITTMQKKMKKTTVPYISFEDRNTKGLTGAEHGEMVQEGDTWGIYAYKKGVHFTEKDSETENLRGGSHGVGKIACNAASDIHMMFFANCDADGKQHLGGTTQLIEHTYGNQNFRASGYFTKVNQDMYYPYENTFGSVFEKNTRGLKIIIPYLREQYQGEDKTIRAVCDNFFAAILEKKLVVYVNDYLIDDETIRDIVKNVSFYPEQNPMEMKDCFSPLYIDTYLKQEPVIVSIADKIREYKFKLYLKYDDEIKRGRVAIVRGIGMKIEDKKIRGFVNSPFNGVMIPVTSEEDIFLKSLENESHTSLSFEHIKDQKIQANAKRFLNNINARIGEIFEALLKENNPSDGKIDTSEVIYSTETNFRKELSKEIPTVQLTKGDKQSSKTLTKVKTNSRKNKKNEKKKEKENGIKKILRKVLKKDGTDKEKERIRYAMYPEAVKRVVLKQKELLLFDFTDVKQYSGETSCDISMAVIDGTGKPYEAEFDVASNYCEIIDNGQKKRCVVLDNIIKNVSISDGKVQLELKLAENFNNSLKFMYYVEV